MKLAAGFIVGFGLLFGYIIAFAIHLGLIREMWLETDAAGAERFPARPQFISTIRAFKRLHPQSPKPRQMWLALAIAVACFVGDVGFVCWITTAKV